jgi:hypothetical protein
MSIFGSSQGHGSCMCRVFNLSLSVTLCLCVVLMGGWGWTGLLRVRTITDRFLQAIIQSLPKMPYPMRFIAQQTMAAVKVGR